jgi:hypothetical protein
MKIKKILRQLRRDFTAIFVCQHCGNEEEKSGYNEFNLSKEQKAAYDFLVEFYSPNSNRAQGRSYVIACVIIRTALDHPGVPINIIDHHDIVKSDSRRHNYMIDTIMGIVNELPDEIKLGIEFSIAHKKVTFIPKKPSRKVIYNSDLIPRFKGL